MAEVQIAPEEGAVPLMPQATLRSGRRSTYVSRLSVGAIPKHREAALSARQRELFAQLRAEAEAETAGVPSRGEFKRAAPGGGARASGRRRTAVPPPDFLQQPTSTRRPKSGRRAAKVEPAEEVDKPVSLKGGCAPAKAGRRAATGAASSAASAAAAVDRANLLRLNKELGLEPEPESEPTKSTTARKKKQPDLFSRLAAEPNGASRHGRNRVRSFGASKAATDAVAMRRQLEAMASQMRKMHTNANQDQRRWEERRQTNQERLDKMMKETRRAIGKGLHQEQVAIERAKLKEARAMPRKLRKHANSWAAFEEAVAAGELEVIGLGDIPFPPADNPLCLPPGKSARKEKKLAFRQSSLRWHPDKFAQRYGQMLDDDEHKQIMELVTETFQQVNEAWQKVVAEEDD